MEEGLWVLRYCGNILSYKTLNFLLFLLFPFTTRLLQRTSSFLLPSFSLRGHETGRLPLKITLAPLNPVCAIKSQVPALWHLVPYLAHPFTSLPYRLYPPTPSSLSVWRSTVDLIFLVVEPALPETLLCLPCGFFFLSSCSIFVLCLETSLPQF